eukprot:scaffold26473_cov138-Skeletonema_dohrnii-CCMP3373.AAC.3
MAECFSCMSPRLGKEDMKQSVFFNDNEVEDHRDEGEQETTQDEIRDEPSPSNDTRDFEFSSTENLDGETTLVQTESKTISNQEEILRKLGILYLDDKVTRARIHETETDEAILRKAGVSLVDTPEYKQEEEKKKFIEKISNKTINEREAKILKESGVLSLAGFSITKDENPTKDDTHLETIENKPLSVTTSDSNSATLALGSINSSYADRKLRRRLRKGWTTTGRECMCGMPVIFLKGTYECVICGVVEEETYCDEVKHIKQVESHMVGGSPGALPSVDHTVQAEKALQAELGHRLFSGWVLVGTRCPACSLPLIGNNSDTPAACVRCG